jgi:hypothetical protein
MWRMLGVRFLLTRAKSRAIHLAYPGVGIKRSRGEEFIAGLGDAVFDSQPVEQGALGLLLVEGELD